MIGSVVKGVVPNVYGPHLPLQKDRFIESLRRHHEWTRGKHWVLGGCFNLITSLDEKKGGRKHLENENIQFRDNIEELKMVDIATGSEIFTWNNKRGGDWHVASRLDHFFISE